MVQKWTGPIGPITIKRGSRDTWVFDTFPEAVGFAHRWRLRLEPYVCPFTYGHLSIMYDEMGMVIPLWRIAEEMAHLPPRPLPSWLRRPLYEPERDFRSGPVPGSGRRYSGFRFYRNVGTHAERRRIHDLEDLEDADEVPIRVKLRAKRKKLPSSWDDIRHARRGNGWKAQRKTQYKPL